MPTLAALTFMYVRIYTNLLEPSPVNTGMTHGVHPQERHEAGQAIDRVRCGPKFFQVDERARLFLGWKPAFEGEIRY